MTHLSHIPSIQDSLCNTIGSTAADMHGRRLRLQRTALQPQSATKKQNKHCLCFPRFLPDISCRKSIKALGFHSHSRDRRFRGSGTAIGKVSEQHSWDCTEREEKAGNPEPRAKSQSCMIQNKKSQCLSVVVNSIN